MIYDKTHWKFDTKITDPEYQIYKKQLSKIDSRRLMHVSNPAYYKLTIKIINIMMVMVVVI